MKDFFGMEYNVSSKEKSRFLISWPMTRADIIGQLLYWVFLATAASLACVPPLPLSKS